MPYSQPRSPQPMRTVSPLPAQLGQDGEQFADARVTRAILGVLSKLAKAIPLSLAPH